MHPETSQVTFGSSIQHATVTSTNATGGARRRQIEMKYYTAKVAPTYVDFERLEYVRVIRHHAAAPVVTAAP